MTRYYIHEANRPFNIYVFQDEDTHTQTAAVYDDDREANRMCDILNGYTKQRTFKFSECTPEVLRALLKRAALI